MLVALIVVMRSRRRNESNRLFNQLRIHDRGDGSYGLTSLLRGEVKELPPKIRYDKREDRARDIKRHDNPNHAGKISHDKRKAEADQQLRDYERDTCNHRLAD